MTHAPFASQFAHSIYNGKYPFFPGETWHQCAERVATSVMGGLVEAPKGRRVLRNSGALERVHRLIDRRHFMPAGRYLYNAGRPYHQVNNCMMLNVEDTREGWAELKHNSMMSLMTGAGIGVYYGLLREANAILARTGGKSSGPIPLMLSVNEDGRAAVSGGDRRAAIWAGLPWWHDDVDQFMRLKDWPEWLRAQKAKDPNTPAPMDMTNISVCLDDDFFAAYGDALHPQHERAQRVYRKVVDKMVTTGEPGFSIDTGVSSDDVLRNPCTEIVSADDSDVCNLGSLVLPRFDTPESFGEAVSDAVLFLTSGTLYSDVPYEKVAEVREKNRRLGLGLIGVHEFCIKHGVGFGTDDSFEVLEPYMVEYERALEKAHYWQDRIQVSGSVAATAIAPNGTIGILAESSPSGDTIVATAAERGVIKASPTGDVRTTHIMVDPVAKRLVAEGADPDDIEDSYSLAFYPERRFAMQSYLQSHVDQAVSSTVNLPAPITNKQEQIEFGDKLMKFLPTLRGITCYPDGARAFQPIKPVDLRWALEHEGEVREEGIEEACVGGVCGV